LFPGDAEEEKKNWDAILTKCRTAHANLTKLKLQTVEAMNCQPKDAGHKIILDKIKRYDSQLESKIKEHLYIITHHTIPDLGEPTTVEHLRKKFVADIGVYF
jgi:hypothetical protein